MKILLRIFIGIFALVLVLVLVGGYFGLVPGVSRIFGADKPVNLGTSFTAQDYSNQVAKSGVQYLDDTSTVFIDKSKISFGPPKPVSSDFTASEVTARINQSPHPADFPLQNAQVRFNADGTAEVSGVLVISKLADYAVARGYSATGVKAALDYVNKTAVIPKEMPFYAKGSGKISNGQLSLSASSVQIGRIPVSESLVNDHKGDIINYFNTRVSGVPGLRIANASIAGGKLHVDGTVPSTIKRK